jgi:nucleoside-diphosphate-sugar epimerase
MSAAGKRTVFTGGSGVAGRHVIDKLLSSGHKILNVDIAPLHNPNVYTLKADLTDGAQAFNSLSCHFRVSEPFMDPIRTPDAVVHFAGKCIYFHFRRSRRVYPSDIALGVS